MEGVLSSCLVSLHRTKTYVDDDVDDDDDRLLLPILPPQTMAHTRLTSNFCDLTMDEKGK